MKVGIVSYSQTGRNNELAKRVSEKLELEHVKVIEKRDRETMTVAWDLLINRTPKVEPETEVLDSYDLVIFFAPVWMGMPATPLRTYFKHIKKNNRKYAFISLSGGADESNPNLKDSVLKRAGANLEMFEDFHVSEFIRDKKPSREDTQSYKMKEEEYEMLAEQIAAMIEKKFLV